eukprot:gene2525-3127_t
MKSCNELKIPIVITEQYPKGLGHTVEELQPSNYKVHEKTLFSMCVPDVNKRLETDLKHVKSILLTGIETHVCILQTALDLLEKNYEVHIICDAVSSQKKYDREVALERLSKAGAFLTTSESAILQLAKDAKHPNFKSQCCSGEQFTTYYNVKFTFGDIHTVTTNFKVSKIGHQVYLMSEYFIFNTQTPINVYDVLLSEGFLDAQFLPTSTVVGTGFIDQRNPNNPKRELVRIKVYRNSAGKGYLMITALDDKQIDIIFDSQLIIEDIRLFWIQN